NLGCSKTRWLALMPAMKRILDMCQGLRSYFLSQTVSSDFGTFFPRSTFRCMIEFCFTQASTFHRVVLKTEGDQISAVDVMEAKKELKINFYDKISGKFLPHKVKMQVKSLEGLTSKKDIEEVAGSFYTTAVEYLQQWSGHLNDLNVEGAGIAIAVFSALLIVVAICLITGAVNGNPFLLVPWMLFNFVFMIVYAVTNIIIAAQNIADGYPEAGAGNIIGVVIYV
ncbi:hypothetical protein ANN_02102, partial [Periplaneta americana]